MRIVKLWRGKPEITDKDIKEMKDWRKELREWTDTTGAFGNMFGGFLGMFGVFAFIMFFYEGCSWRESNGPDNILNPKEEEKVSNPHVFLHNDFDAAAWILYK
jgi:hypothetical protein